VPGARVRSISRDPTVVEVPTPQGPARVHLCGAGEPRGVVVLGHGASGGVAARDLVRVSEVALETGFSSALVEQPYRVAGRRSPAPAPRLDEAWTAVLARLRAVDLRGLPMVVGGRSAGARVACRTAVDCGAIGVLCLAFPLHAPRRSTSGPVTTRQAELDAVALPTLVVQGAGDPFGVPEASATRKVVIVPGNHSLTADLDAVGQAVREWLSGLLG